MLGNWKLIYDQRRNTKRIYNLDQDPHEQNNLANTGNKINKTLAMLLSQYISYVEKKQRLAPAQDQIDLFTPEQRKQLESFGYL